MSREDLSAIASDGVNEGMGEAQRVGQASE